MRGANLSSTGIQKSAVGDAAGVVLCVEEDGHAVLELSQTKGCCSDAVAASTDEPAVWVRSDCGPCLDMSTASHALNAKLVHFRGLVKGAPGGSTPLAPPNRDPSDGPSSLSAAGSCRADTSPISVRIQR